MGAGNAAGSRDKNKELSLKCTFVNKNNEQQTIEIPREFIDRTRRSLGCDVREACQIYLSDEGYIENDYVEFLNAKANGTKRGAPKRKEDLVKRALIEKLFECVRDSALPVDDGSCPLIENAAVTNPERIIQFKINDDIYELTLSKKRKPKA